MKSYVSFSKTASHNEAHPQTRTQTSEYAVEACTISKDEKMLVPTFGRKSNGDHIFVLLGCAALRF